MSDTQSSLLEAVVEAARLAGTAALAHFGARIDVETKPDGSPVTIADREAEQVVRDWIERRFPADGIVGEELGSVRLEARRRWIVDPIDGTKSFVRGVPLWGSLIAICDGDTVLAGASFFPAIDDVLAAAIGEGCWLNGARCAVSTVSSVHRATVLTTDERFPLTPDRRAGWRRLADNAAVARSWGDCYGYLLVASGRAEVMLDGILSDWDAAALYPAIVEAGGVFTDCAGRHTAFGRSAVATNAALARECRALLDVPYLEP